MHGRPLSNHGLPIELYHPIFDEFRTTVHESTPITARDYELVTALCIRGAEIHETEDDRKDALYLVLEIILDVNFTRVGLRAAGRNSFGADKVISAVMQGRIGYLAFIETKNEIGSGHCDPAIQASLSYRTHWVQPNVSP